MAAANGSEASDAGYANIVKIEGDESLDHYLYRVQNTGRIVIIDYASSKRLEVPAKSSHVYEITFKNKICFVRPIDSRMRSDFLQTKIPAYTLSKANIEQAIGILGDAAGSGLYLLEIKSKTWERHMGFELNIYLRDKTAVEILAELATACHAGRVSLVATLDGKDNRLTGVTGIMLFP